MSIFSWLLGKKNSGSSDKSSGVESSRTVEVALDHPHSNSDDGSDWERNFIELPSHKFFGNRTRSPNGRYTVAWLDGDGTGHGGARSSGKGRYLLLSGKQVIVDGHLERPNNGKVANNGTFIFNDWRFTSELAGTFYAFRSDGTKILQRKFKANLLNNGLSEDGRYAACQTCNSTDEQDNSILALFDLETAKELASWQPETGWADQYEFDPANRHILLVHKDGPPLRYSFEGEFLDKALWENVGISRGDLRIISMVLKDAGSELSEEIAPRLIAGLDRNLQSSASMDPRTRAWALKLKGSCLDGMRDHQGALECYEQALALDPKIGVKRRTDQLRKKIESQTGS